MAVVKGVWKVVGKTDNVHKFKVAKGYPRGYFGRKAILKILGGI